MIVAGTGHRPNHPKMGGYNEPNNYQLFICRQLEDLLSSLKPDKVISGMALGFDTMLAETALKLNIQLVAAIPFLDQEKVWPDKSKERYHKILDRAEKVIVSNGSYSARKMQIRNEYMVDSCDVLLACFDKSSTSGGTYNCIQYAFRKNKHIIYLEL